MNTSEVTKEITKKGTKEATAELVHPVLSKAALFKACIVATLLAAAALVVAILPAEYGIDPTGIGQRLGLTALNQDSAGEESALAAAPVEKQSTTAFREDATTINIPAGGSLEYKFSLLKGEAMKFSWQTAAAALFFDFHGEPAGNTTGYFESYAVSTSNSVRGTFTAPFTGSHGWYWKNKTRQPVAIELLTSGNYQVIGLK